MRIDASFGARVLDAALRKGADLAEVYVKSSRNLSVEVKGRAVDAVESSIDFGYSLRVIREGRLGFSYATDMAEADVVVEQAVESSLWTEQDPFLDIPVKSAGRKAEVFDPAVSAVTETDAVSRALEVEAAALGADRRITKVRKASASFSATEILILNSRGVSESYEKTAAASQIMVVAEEAGDSQTGWEFEGSRFLADVSFGEVGRMAAERAIRLLGARKMAAVKAPVILENSVAVDFLGIFSVLLSAEAVQKGKSLLADRSGREVVSPGLSVVDDGSLPRRLGSRPVDDEGVATVRTELIRNGVLLGFLHNTRTAGKDSVQSTGNAIRHGFSSVPAVGPANLVLEADPAIVYKGPLTAVPEKCLLVTEAMGMHTANPVSGEFSIGVSGIWFEQGQARFPVKEAVVSGNILGFLQNVEAAGDDFRFFGNLGSPSLLIGPTDISA